MLDRNTGGLGMSALTDEERKLLAAIAAAAADVDPVPDDVIRAGQGSLAWLSIDAKLAQLVEDSGLSASGVRSGAASRLLVFAAGAVEIDVEVTRMGDDELRLIGQITPAARGTVEVRQPGITEPVAAEIDEYGRFICAGVRPGQVSLACTVEGAEKPVVTSWMKL